jgi:fructose-bisphosphate aldolase class I
MNHDIEETARALVAKGKGILAADESFGTIEKRFKQIGIPSSEENRRDYREMLFTAPDFGKSISGVILFDETLRQKSADGTPLVEVLTRQGSIPGIKVDAGAVPLAFSPKEKITEGLDGLRQRLNEYFELGARFTKWRAVIDIDEGIPTDYCIQANAEALARYAALSQEAGLVPIVEPEVLMDGAHDIDRCAEVTERTLVAVFDGLHLHRVCMEGMLLKPNMVIAGKKSANQAGVQQVAEATVRCLKRTVPPAVPGIVFLSGGQSEEEATAHLNAMNAMGPLPWALSFSYGRALQQAALTAWSGRKENVAAGQRAFAHRARLNSMATTGEYRADLEKAA